MQETTLPKAHALHAFQRQLTQRLQQANRTIAAARSCVAVATGERRWLFELAHTAEILPLAALTPVPFTRDWFLGLINHRSQLTSVIDLEAFADASGDIGATTPKANDRLLVLSPSLPLRCAIRVTQMFGVVDRDRFSAAPDGPAQPAWCPLAFHDEKQLRWTWVDLPALMNTSAFLDICRR